MNQSTLKVNNRNEYINGAGNYQNDPQRVGVIKGYFPKENIRKEMAIKKINTTLTSLLVASLLITAVSYYFATANEMVLNDLNRQTVILNDENMDLQNKLDNLKSFNNVDMSMQKSNMLQKAQHVMEVPAVSSNIIPNKKINPEKPFVWAVGY